MSRKLELKGEKERIEGSRAWPGKWEGMKSIKGQLWLIIYIEGGSSNSRLLSILLGEPPSTLTPLRDSMSPYLLLESSSISFLFAGQIVGESRLKGVDWRISGLRFSLHGWGLRWAWEPGVRWVRPEDRKGVAGTLLVIERSGMVLETSGSCAW